MQRAHVPQQPLHATPHQYSAFRLAAIRADAYETL
ncbi:hypothetical protein X744_29080 [Mesorhizobium sp. LNJC372A00]|nr:hypothetical protein X744_29080 [Mesorhizobium sp. LNJC372A00]